MLGNGVVGILSESVNKWERRVPLTPSHCARLLNGGKDKTGVARIIVQPSTKRIHHDALYEDVGCEISEDLSECGLIVGVKQPKIEMIFPDRAYAFFSHTHKAQKENMPLLDKILAEKCSLYDYELIVGDHGRRLLSFGKFAGRAGMIDFLSGLGQRYLGLGYSTPFLSLGASHMYTSLAAAKSAVISVGEEIATLGLPSGICPLVFIFTGSGNVSLGAQELFKLLPHVFVEPSKLPEIFAKAKDSSQPKSKRIFQVYGCFVTSEDMVEHKDPEKRFDKEDYYAHPEHYNPVFHKKIAPYASVIVLTIEIALSAFSIILIESYLDLLMPVASEYFQTKEVITGLEIAINCMYWEKRFPRLLSTQQLQDLMRQGCPLVGISDITCDIGGSIEFVNQSTSIDSPFFRYDHMNNSYHHDMEGNGVICLAVDILPTEFAKEASQHFGDILSEFIGSLASTIDIKKLPSHLSRACIVHRGALTSLYEYIRRMRNSDSEDTVDNHGNSPSKKKKNYNILVDAGGSFHLVKCQLGQSTGATSYSELEVGADDGAVLDQIIDSLTSLANPKENNGIQSRVCQPAAELLASVGSISSRQWLKTCMENDFEGHCIQVLVGSLFRKDAEEIVEGIPNAVAIQLDVMNRESLHKYISEVEIVISLLPASFHIHVANACIELKKHLVTASYVDDSMSKLNEKAKSAGITILGEMGLDPGIDHMLAMKMINEARARKGKIKSFTSFCGGLPSPAAANNPLAYKFSWSPAGAIRAGRNPATYKSQGEILNVDGKLCAIQKFDK
ncbi:hypothetical protein Patl1_13709 [Pistacia atlantica]|uniref:Uncharacterized protein n=1 Tax=Pistacia atlantica TaxID=434234 RepID=A0ACC1AXD5_9ROSI|nr:hypothetical protein Patl1_13709 [Pistacia atlantica]